MKRRQFLVKNSVLLGGLGISSVLPLYADTLFLNKKYIPNRPKPEERKFTSRAVEQLIQEIKKVVSDKELAWMFENCYPNTLDTTVDYEIINEKPDTFIITGDIDAMWLRDSTAQVWPYLPLIKKDEKLKNLVWGLINRQAKCIVKDPYANAFYKDLQKESDWKEDLPKTVPGVHERKWEVDSLCYSIRLAYHYYQLTGDKNPFDKNWEKAARLIVKTFKTEQRKDGKSPYYFIRKTTAMIDAPIFNGTGRPIKPTGMICSMFRPSDDATLFPYLIPSNIFAVISLRQLAEIYRKVINDPNFSNECSKLADEVETGIKKYGTAHRPNFGEIYAYEVDGFGNQSFMDDANVPSLMSLAYLDASKADAPIYKNTRKFLLSDWNPYFLKGKVAEGQACPHTGKDKIWPMGIILRAMTSKNQEEIIHCLHMLKNTHAGTGFMHEAFDKDDATKFTRLWFAWANTLFGELIIKIYHERRAMLSKIF